MAGVTSDFLILSRGVIGVNTALQTMRRCADTDAALVEKESDGDEHASGRHSGILHAGFYYSVDSLKAQSTEVGLDKQAQPDTRSDQVDFGLYKQFAPDHQPQATLSGAIQDLADRLEFMKFSDSDFRNSQLIRFRGLSDQCTAAFERPVGMAVAPVRTFVASM